MTDDRDPRRAQVPGGPGDTSEHSASKAPETREEAEEKHPFSDFRLIPGGQHRADTEVGMSAMDRADVPSEGKSPGQTKYGDSPESA